jgi:acetyl-CoA carboxylase biotin carboxyl carrier protein
VSEDPLADTRRPPRKESDRGADHKAIERLSAELLPALIAKLGATGLGELEVREGAWRVRLRRPEGSSQSGPGRRSSDRSSDRSGERGSERADRGSRSSHRTAEAPATARTSTRSVATSPGVGIFQPRAELAAGTRVRAGDRLGAVDVLGVAQEVVAPVDGVVGASLAESGDAVEYGQELVVIEFDPAAASSANGSGG